MLPTVIQRIALFSLACTAALAGASDARAQQAAPAILFRSARVFDGRHAVEREDVLVRGASIAAVGRQLVVPAGATIVDASGKTLLPGLIDAHTHAFGAALEEALIFGVTTELDMFTNPAFARQMRADQAAGKANTRADLFSAGTLVTAPKGHGTEYGFAIPTITSPDSAQAFVDARIAEGSDYIKIIYDDGSTYGRSIPTVSKATMQAVVKAAHRRGKLAVVHIASLSGARDAVDVGADGLAHLFVDRDPDPGFGKFVAAHHAFVVPTLTVNMSVTGTAGGASLMTDKRLEPYITVANAALLRQGFPRRPGQPPVSYAAAEEAVKQLRAAGVPILAGTDSPNPGTAHGVALHRELELLVHAGLTPSEALASATSVPAREFHLAGRGRIAKGMRADVLLVNGDPTRDITASRDIAGVWKAGVPVNREAFAQRVTNSRAARAAGAQAGGLISDFESGSLAAAFGTAWVESLDSYAGGQSTGDLKVVDGGANGSRKSLLLTGKVSGAVPFAWAGGMWAPGDYPMVPVDLSAKKMVSFWTRGDGQTYKFMVFSKAKGFQPLMRDFVAGPDWSEVSMPWSDFGVDGSDVMAIVIAAGPNPGPFSIQIDDVRLR
jgi:imidazolonepropionase-like amidohydrolase